jgi:hypothetical protein
MELGVTMRELLSPRRELLSPRRELLSPRRELISPPSEDAQASEQAGKGGAEGKE